MQIGERLKFYRKRSGKTLRELHGLTKLSISFLSDIERGKAMPSLATCQKLVDVYRITLSLLFSGVEVDADA